MLGKKELTHRYRRNQDNHTDHNGVAHFFPPCQQHNEDNDDSNKRDKAEHDLHTSQYLQQPV